MVAPMSATDCQLLTLPEAAAQLRISVRSFHRLVAARKFPQPLSIGGRSLVPSSDLSTYVARLIQARSGGAS